jgi:hypothetical protein
VTLAKFLCGLLLETIKVYDQRSEAVPEEIRRPPEELCQEVLGSFHECKASTQFWYSDIWKSRPNGADESAEFEPAEKGGKETKEEIDEDDDSDLEPIDTLDVPSKSGLVYIRDFLEGLPEMKTFDETRAAFSALPTIVKHQLGFEHPQVGRDLIDAVFGWENTFESPGSYFFHSFNIKFCNGASRRSAKS